MSELQLPHTLDVFYTPQGNNLMFVRQLNPNEHKLTLELELDYATLSWHQTRDLAATLNAWVASTSPMVVKEN